MLHGVVQMGGSDQALKVHHWRTDTNRSALIVEQGDRVDLFGRPAVPVAGHPGVGRVRTERIVHSQKIGHRPFFAGSHPAPSQ